MKKTKYNITAMEKPKIKLLIYLSLVISSCNQEISENNTINEIPKQSTDYKEITLQELGYNSYEDMLADGWEIIYKTKQDKFSESKMDKKANLYQLTKKKENHPIKSFSNLSKAKIEPFFDAISYSGVREKLTNDHIKDLKLYDNELLEIYYYAYNKYPDGVAINNYGTAWAYKPLITNRYDYYTYIQTGAPIVKIEHIENRYVNNSTWLYNNSDKEKQIQKIFVIDEKNIIDQSINNSLNIKMNTKIKLLIDKDDFNYVEIPVGKKSKIEDLKETITKTATAYYMARLPPHSKREFIIKQNIITKHYNYSFNIYTRGSVGLNFPSRVNGHYFLPADAASLLKNRDFTQRGKIIIEKRTPDIEIIAGKPIPYY